MNTSQRKQPLLFIGLVIFLAVAVVGILYDFIAKAGGVVAIISVAVAFLVLIGALVADALMRRREKAQADEYNNPYSAEDRQFIRHTGDQKEDDSFSWNGEASGNSVFDDFYRMEEELRSDAMKEFDQPAFEDESSDVFEKGFDEDFEGGFENNEEPFEMNDDSADVAEEEPVEEPQPVQGRRNRYAGFFERGSKAAEEVKTDNVEPEIAAEAAELQPETEEPTAEPEIQEDLFKPVLKLDGSANEAVQQEEQIAEEPSAEEVPAEETLAEPEVQPEPEEKTQPTQEKQPAPAPERKAAAYAASAVAATAAGGQTIESFYEEMSEEDILYRDCVEVWAADAKPAALRLIKYVEGIEDKQTAALIGREVEYVNAMIDRINCFTQLEYIDELLEYKEHNYSTLVKDCLKRFSPFFMEKRLGLLWKGLDINILTDRRWFIFALTQVIFNAVEFTPNGGKIAISAKKHEDFIDLTVEDSGKGISSDELPFIFMAGYMGDDAPNESGRRTGMGLFIAQSVMRKMGGDMLAESVQGKGTRITLRMPIIDPMA